jgi:glycosyltransferase involved in cell wall biosynthesis
MARAPEKHIALQFGQIKHFNEGLAEFSRQLALHLALEAPRLLEERGWQFHCLLPSALHGMFGNHFDYHPLTNRQRHWHRTSPPFDLWHGLHQHMRYRAPANSGRRLVTVHDLNHLHAKKGLSLRWQNWRLRRQLAQAHRLVAISRYVQQDIQAHMPWAAPVSVVFNGVADLTTVPQEPIPTLAGAAFFLHISRMSPTKNVASLIDLAAIWPEKRFVLAGPDSVEVDRHRQRVAELKLGNVKFLPNVTEGQKAWLYAHCEAFLFPSLMEGFGLPPVEAMHFGKPVIVARRSCLPEVCGENVFYWDQFDPDYMKKIVVKGGHQVAQGHVKAEAIRGDALRYSWSRSVSDYLQVYELELSKVKVGV